MVKAWSELAHERQLFISNNSNTTKTFTLIERIPIAKSDNIKVVVDTKETSSGGHFNNNGLVQWDLTLEGGEHKHINLFYKVKTNRERH